MGRERARSCCVAPSCGEGAHAWGRRGVCLSFGVMMVTREGACQVLFWEASTMDDDGEKEGVRVHVHDVGG